MTTPAAALNLVITTLQGSPLCSTVRILET